MATLLYNPESRIGAKFVRAYPTETDATAIPRRHDPTSMMAGLLAAAVGVLIMSSAFLPSGDTPAAKSTTNAWTSLFPIVFLLMIVAGTAVGALHPLARGRILAFKAIRRLHLISTVPVPAQEGFVEVAQRYHLPMRGYWWTEGPAPTLGEIMNKYHSPITADRDLELMAQDAPDSVRGPLVDALRLLGRRLAIREIVFSGHVLTLDEVARVRLLHEARALRELAI